jgi:thioesterase domain-containing protein
MPIAGAAGEPIPSTVPQLAESLLKSVRSLRPQGPYAIAGFCRSGPVALELAQQLQRDGEDVEHLVVIDSPIENTNALLRGLERFISITATVTRWDAEQQLAWFLAGRRWLQGLDRLVTGQTIAREPATGPDRIGDAYHRARRGYIPRPYSGRLLLISRKGEALDPRWLKISPTLDAAQIAASHATCLTEDLQTLCGLFEQALNAPTATGITASSSDRTTPAAVPRYRADAPAC